MVELNASFEENGQEFNASMGEVYVVGGGGEAIGAVRYDLAQELTDAQKALARSNIGAADIDDGGGSADAVLYTKQTLTDEQKAQARENIGAAAPGEGGGSSAEGAILYTPQTLTDEQKAQARANIGAAGIGEGGGGDASIDDTVISQTSTWSSQNIVDKLCPSFNESGATVTCEPLEGLPLEVVSHIVPKQAGSGDPSLTNIRPITGCDSIKLSHTGKNLFGGEVLADAIVAVGGVKDTANGKVHFNPAIVQTKHLFYGFIPNTQYTIILYGRNTNASISASNMYVWYTDGTKAGIPFQTKGEESYAVLTTPMGKSVESFGAVWADGETDLYYEKCGIFEGEISALDFEPYNNNSETFTIDLGQTVYGGTYNWHTGRLSISYASIVFDGVTNGKKVTGTDSGAKTYAYFAPLVKPNASKTIYSDRASCSAPGAIVVRIPADVTGVTDSDNATSVVAKINATLKSWYDAGTPLTCVYEVASPTSVQLTPQEILALEGTNVLYSNTGDTEVKAKAVADFVIQDLYNKLNALTATMTALTGV